MLATEQAPYIRRRLYSLLESVRTSTGKGMSLLESVVQAAIPAVQVMSNIENSAILRGHWPCYVPYLNPSPDQAGRERL